MSSIYSDLVHATKIEGDRKDRTFASERQNQHFVRGQPWC